VARDLARGGQGRTCLDWHTGSILGLFAATVVLFAAWGAVEWASSTPLVDMRMMRIPAVWTTNAASLLFGFGMFAAFVLIPQFVQTPSRVGYGFGCAITQAGCFLVPIVVGMIIGGALTGPIAAAVGSKPSLAAGGVCSATAFGLLTATPTTSYVDLLRFGWLLRSERLFLIVMQFLLLLLIIGYGTLQAAPSKWNPDGHSTPAVSITNRGERRGA